MGTKKKSPFHPIPQGTFPGPSTITMYSLRASLHIYQHFLLKKKKFNSTLQLKNTTLPTTPGKNSGNIQGLNVNSVA